MKQVVPIFCLTLLAFNSIKGDDRVVEIADGSVRGLIEQTPVTGRDLYVFEKIPYASPPVGNLRFLAPIPPKKWSGVLNATGLDVICFQVSIDATNESEDCLYLNVYTTYLPVSSDHLMPVIIFLYGGGFVYGDTKQLNPRNLIEQDVVVVSINYRVGPFGFLSTQDDVIPGNAGLKDQQMAIKWVYDNIKTFGGDPKRITLMGFSAGAASASYQLLNPQNEGLIKSVILFSGSFLSPGAFQRNSREIAFNTTAILNPIFRTSRDSKALLKFMQGVIARSVDRASNSYHDLGNPHYQELSSGSYYAPVIEAPNPTAFLTEKMYGLLKSGKILKVPALVGLNSEEMLSYFQDQNFFKETLKSYDSLPSQLVPHDMRIKDARNASNLGLAIRNLYAGNGKKLIDNLGKSLGYFSDDIVSRSIIKYAELASKLNRTYFYEFSYQGQVNAQKVYYEGAGRASHGDDFYLLSRPVSSDGDKLAAQRLIQIVANFAKTQNPTPETSSILNNIRWPAIDIKNGDFQYVEIGNNVSIKNHPKRETYNAWVKLYDSLGYDDFDTY